MRVLHEHNILLPVFLLFVLLVFFWETRMAGIMYLLSSNSHLSSFIFHFSSFIFHFSSFIFHLSSFIFHLSSFIFHLSSFIFHLSSFIFHLSSFIFHLSSFIFHFSSFIFHLRWSCLISLSWWIKDIDESIGRSKNLNKNEKEMIPPRWFWSVLIIESPSVNFEVSVDQNFDFRAWSLKPHGRI